MPTIAFNFRKIRKGTVTMKIWDVAGIPLFPSKYLSWCQYSDCPFRSTEASFHVGAILPRCRCCRVSGLTWFFIQLTSVQLCYRFSRRTSSLFSIFFPTFDRSLIPICSKINSIRRVSNFTNYWVSRLWLGYHYWWYVNGVHTVVLMQVDNTTTLNHLFVWLAR